MFDWNFKLEKGGKFTAYDFLTTFQLNFNPTFFGLKFSRKYYLYQVDLLCMHETNLICFNVYWTSILVEKID